MSTKKGLILGQDQYAGYRTNKISKIMGKAVAELYNRTQYISTREYRNIIY